MRTCERCGKPFHAPPSRVAIGKGVYCSRSCSSQARRTRPGKRRAGRFIHQCVICGSSFTSQHSFTRYCSNKCRGKGQLGASNPFWKGGQPLTKCIACGIEFPVPPSNRGWVCSWDCYLRVRTKLNPGCDHPRGKGGKRADLGEIYFRSRWEANWARYLNWRIEQGEILRWEFEPDTFEFAGIKRGTRFYTPDFKVYLLNGSTEYHEVKGWLDQKGRTKLRRMKKYYPEIKIVLIDRSLYRSVALTFAKLLPGWETSPKKGVL